MTFLKFWSHYQSHINLSCPLRKWRSKLVVEFCWCNAYLQSTFGIIYITMKLRRISKGCIGKEKSLTCKLKHLSSSFMLSFKMSSNKNVCP
jgi:hypothetical protein